MICIDPIAKRLERMPLIGALVAFMVGLCGTMGCMVAAAAFALLALVVWTAYRFERNKALMGAALMLLGGGLGALHRPLPIAPTNQQVELKLEVLHDPIPHQERWRCEARLLAWRPIDEGQWRGTSHRIGLYIDSLDRLPAADDHLQMVGRIYTYHRAPQALQQRMLHRQRIGTCYLSNDNLVCHTPFARTTLHNAATRHLTALLGPDSEERSIILAMSIGADEAISPTLRQAYSRSGMAHLLAVSGLHTGFVFLIINLLLWWMPFLSGGHRLRNLVSILLLWGYVALAGGAPSAVRAAVMCTLLQFALYRGSHYTALNSWAAAALLLLVIKPTLLFDVGFRLSFAAVAGILLWGVPLIGRLHTPYRWLNYLLSAWVVALTASIAVAPLTAAIFAQVGWAGVWLSPLVVPLGALILCGGLLLLLLPPLQGLITEPLVGLANLQNNIAEWSASMAWSRWDIALSEGDAVVCYLIMALLTAAGWCWRYEKKVIFVGDDKQR